MAAFAHLHYALETRREAHGLLQHSLHPRLDGRHRTCHAIVRLLQLVSLPDARVVRSLLLVGPGYRVHTHVHVRACDCKVFRDGVVSAATYARWVRCGAGRGLIKDDRVRWVHFVVGTSSVVFWGRFSGNGVLCGERTQEFGVVQRLAGMLPSAVQAMVVFLLTAKALFPLFRSSRQHSRIGT